MAALSLSDVDFCTQLKRSKQDTLSYVIMLNVVRFVEKKLSNRSPFRELADKHSIYSFTRETVCDEHE